MKRIFISAILALGAGCADYQETQLHLIDQARKGVSLVQLGQASQIERIERIDQLQRQRLDEAFDRDVLESDSLSPDWVIEHRKAYIAGIDALNRQRLTAQTTIETQTRNLQAVDAALAALRRIKEAERQLTQTEK